MVTQFQELAGLCLRAARIELQMKVVYHVQSLPAVSFSGDELDIDQDDAHTRELSEIFSNVTEELREKTIQPVYDFCLAPLAETIPHEIICILPEIDTINANGSGRSVASGISRSARASIPNRTTWPSISSGFGGTTSS